MAIINKPQSGEFAPYIAEYIKWVPDEGLLIDYLRQNMIHTTELIGNLPEDKLTYRYAPGKWTVKDILCHITDGERVLAYRALRAARNDTTELPGYDQDLFAPNANANNRGIKSLLNEFHTVREATISLFNNLERNTYLNSTVAGGHPLSVRAAGYFIAGHELHHVNVIKERYL